MKRMNHQLRNLKSKILFYPIRVCPCRWFRTPDPVRSCRKAPKIAGTWKQYSGRKFSGFFRRISANFLCFPAGTGRKALKKFPAGILLPQNRRNYSKPVVSGPDCSTWVIFPVNDPIFLSYFFNLFEILIANKKKC